MMLQETIPMMISSDYKERFVAEYAQLAMRMENLEAIITEARAGRLDFELSCPLLMLETQYVAMEVYRDILKDRAKVENIKLPIFSFDFGGEECEDGD